MILYLSYQHKRFKTVHFLGEKIIGRKVQSVELQNDSTRLYVLVLASRGGWGVTVFSVLSSGFDPREIFEDEILIQTKTTNILSQRKTIGDDKLMHGSRHRQSNINTGKRNGKRDRLALKTYRENDFEIDLASIPSDDESYQETENADIIRNYQSEAGHRSDGARDSRVNGGSS
jgi:hypothetical protein